MIVLSKLCQLVHSLFALLYILSPQLFVFKGQFAIFHSLISVCTRNQPNRQFEKIKKIFFVLQLLQIKVFGK